MYRQGISVVIMTRGWSRLGLYTRIFSSAQWTKPTDESENIFDL